ncbi:extracellular calcium-sensing receptor-like [Polyodon spathula]|uniref:extracellular calcium-sensing receptor-like n=1 Tax=Polyodon spathula TaxID=7913 RepID=UPI001B7DF0F9|nr:extracellular calcium-sensing receptor-like [Polyodon spathula]
MALAAAVLILVLKEFAAAQAVEPTCMKWKNLNLPNLFQHGDVVLGGLFGLYFEIIVKNETFRTSPEWPVCGRSFFWAQTMIFAIEEINQDSTLLPNVKLGYKIHDSCGRNPKALEGALSLISPQDEAAAGSQCTGTGGVPVIIGTPSSTQSIIISGMLAPFGFPLVSYYATCACLSNKKEFPNFFRTIPSDFHQARGIAQIAKRFGWTWIGTIASNNDYGLVSTRIFIEEVKAAGACIAFSETLSTVYPEKDSVHIADVIKRSSAQVIVVIAGDNTVFHLFKELLLHNITNRQFIASEAWSTTRILSDFLSVTSGVLGIAIGQRYAEIPGLAQFLVDVHPSKFPGNVFVRELWENSFNCKLPTVNLTEQASSKAPLCNGSENLREVKNGYTDMSHLGIAHNVYKAVYATAHALHNLHLCQNRSGPFQNKSCGNINNLQPGELLHYLKTVRFRTKLGVEVYFDENGDIPATYDIVNWQTGKTGALEIVTVGQIDGSEIYIDDKDIVWAGGMNKVPVSICTENCPPGTRKAARKGEPICCYDCILCSEGSISNTTNSLQCMKCPLEYWPNGYRNKCIPREIEFLSFEDAMGITITAVSLSGMCMTVAVAAVFLYYKNTPIVRANNSELSFILLFSITLCFLCSLCFIGQPSDWSCMVQYTAFAISFVLCISCILVKTIVVMMAFRTTLPGKDVMKRFGSTQQRNSVFANTFIQIIICIIWLSTSPPVADRNTSYQSSKIILKCVMGSVTGYSCVLGYIGLLACICFLFAFLARNLPDNFNEAKYITFSMLIFCAVWITFILAYISSPGKYTTAVETFAILSSSFGLLGCIFVPKCYIILLKPEKNTKKHLMGRKLKQ